MNILLENWLLILLLAACVGMHFFGHRHSHGGNEDNPHARHRPPK